MSQLPRVIAKRIDGGLRLAGPSVDGIHLKIGYAVGGVVNQVVSESDGTTAQADFLGGPLLTAAAVSLEKVSPVLMMKMAASTPGTFVTPVGIGAARGADGATLTLTLANGQPYRATSVDLKFTSASTWDAGTITITGTDAAGNSQTETVNQAAIQALGAGAQVWRGKKVFLTISSIAKAAQGADTGTVTAVFGNKTTAQASSDSSFWLSGTPTNRWQVQARLEKDGNVTDAAALPAFSYTLDDGNSWVGPLAMPVNGAYPLPSGLQTGLTLNFAGAACKAGDVFRQECVAPVSTTQDLSDALAAANASQFDFECIHVVGPLDAVSAAVVSSYITAAENQSSPKPWFAVIEVRDQNPDGTETESAWINAISGTSPGFQNFADYRISAAAGFGEILDPLTGRIERRSLAWPYAGRLMEIPVGVDPGEVALGPVTGITKLYHDEAAREALDSQRFATFRTFGRLQGYYVTLGRMLYPVGSDFRKVQYLRVINKAMRLVYDALLIYVNSRIKVDAKTGRILEKQARAIELPIVTLLKTILGDNITEPRVRVDRTRNMIVESKLSAKVGIVPVGYAEIVEFGIGLINPAIEQVA